MTTDRDKHTGRFVGEDAPERAREREARRLIERLVECHVFLDRKWTPGDRDCKTIREAREWLAAQ